MNRLLLPALILLPGCAGLQEFLGNVVNAVPSVGGDIATGAGEVAASGGFSVPGWLKIVGGVAALGAAAFGGPKAVSKVKGIFGK